MSIKLIAIGNRIMGDDGLAIAAVEELSKELDAMGIEVVIGETDVEYCLNCINEGDFIIILDAAISGMPYATVWVQPLCDAFYSDIKCQSQHDINLVHAIQIRNLRISGILICIEAVEIGLKLGLSEIIQGEFTRICKQIKEAIIKYRGEISMHDSLLLQKISLNLQRICKESKIDKITEAVIEVSYNSHIDSRSLQEHLLELLPELLDSNAVITVKKTELEEQTAVIYMLKGDKLEPAE